MYLLSKLHPNEVEIEGDTNKAAWLNADEKRTQIDRFYAEQLRIPLNLEHKGANRQGYVPRADHIGHVVDIFNDRKGDLIVKCYVDRSHPAYQQISQGMRKERWGVSVWISHYWPQGVGQGQPEKSITHVALTTDPAMAAQETFFTHWALNEKAMDNEIHRRYFSKEGYFVGPLLDRMLSRVGMSENGEAMNLEQLQQQQATPVPYQLRHLTEQSEISDLKAEIKAMDEHMRVDKAPFCDMDPEFKKRYMSYLGIIEQKSAKSNEFIRSLVSEHYSEEQANAVIRVLSNPSPSSLEGDNKLTTFVSATRGAFEELQDKYAKSEEEKKALAEAMEQQKREREDERQRMEEMGRKRPSPFVGNQALAAKYHKYGENDVHGQPAIRAPSTFNKYGFELPGSAMKQEQPASGLAGQKQPQSYNLLQCGELLGSQAVELATLNHMLPKPGEYTKQHNYDMGADMYQLFQEMNAGIQNTYMTSTAAVKQAKVKTVPTY